MPADDLEKDHVVIKIDSALSEEANKAFFTANCYARWRYDNKTEESGAFDKLPKEHRDYLCLKEMAYFIEKGAKEDRGEEIYDIAENLYTRHYELKSKEDIWPHWEV